MCYGHDGDAALACAMESRGVSRRFFLRGALAASVAAGVGGAGLAAAGPAAAAVPVVGSRRIVNHRISIQLYSLRSILGGGGFDTVLRQLADMGYRNVELAGYYGRTAPELRTFLDSIGIKATSAHEGISPNRTELDKKVANSVALGEDYIVVPYLASGAADDWKMWADQMNEEAIVARRAGLRYGYHNHAHEFAQVLDNGQTAWEILTSRLNPKYVHLEVDLYWAVTGGMAIGESDPVQFAIDTIAEAPQRTRQFHVKDKHAVGGDMADLGYGIIDFPRIFDAHRVDEYIVENDTPDVTPIMTAQIGIDYLRGIRY